MAEQITRSLPAEFIEGLGKAYATDLTKAIGETRDVDLSKFMGSQFVAPESALTQQAYQQVGGLGSFEPYLKSAAALTGPKAYQQKMSPYQQDVIDTTLAEFDRQTAMGLPALSDRAIQSGAFGGGRQGVLEAEYATGQARNRAALQAQLLQQGVAQAQQQAQQDFAKQFALAEAAPALSLQQISGLQALGTQQQAQAQAALEADKQLAQAQAYQPLTTAQVFGQGIAALTPGAYGGTQIANVPAAPTPSALQTALGTASTLAGIYKAVKPSNPFNINIG